MKFRRGKPALRALQLAAPSVLRKTPTPRMPAYTVPRSRGETATVLTASCDGPQFLEVEWGGSAYAALEFVIGVERSIPVTYVG